MLFPILFLSCWGVLLFSQITITVAFGLYRRAIVRRRITESSPSKAEPSDARKLSFVQTEGSADQYFIQKGYSKSLLGEMVRIGWLFFMVAAFVVMVLLAPVSYFPDLYAALGTDWNGIMGPYLFVFALFHGTAAFMISFYDSVRASFMLPESSMATATHVVIEEVVPVLDESAAVDPGSTADENIPTWFRVLITNWRKRVEGLKAASQRTIVKVVISDSGEDRFIEYTSVRYCYDDAEDRFRPAGNDINITPKESARLLKSGGLSQSEADIRMATVGPNEIRVKVPGIIESLITEFSSLFYVVQSMGSWTYLGYSGWNIGLIWLLMMILTGSVKALFIVRRGQKKIAELARHTTDVSVLRDSEWTPVSSSEITLGDIIQVDEEQLPCDGHVLTGAVVVNESMLTGEPMPVQKIAAEVRSEVAFTSKSLVHAGTLCMESTGTDGKAKMVVTAVGCSTTKGQLIRMVMFPQPVRFKYHDQLPIVYAIMFGYAMIICFLYLGLTNMGNWIVTLLQIFLVLLQALNPMLPVSTVMGQTVAAKRLRNHHKIFCLQPERIPVAGKISVMVFDKTGTITKDGMELSGILPARGGVFDDAVCSASSSISLSTNRLPKDIIYGLAACHTVKKLRDGRLVGNHVEITMLETCGWSLLSMGAETTVTSPDGKTVLEVLRSLPFDHARMTSGCVVRVRGSGRTMVLVKGSYERIGECCLESGLPIGYSEKADKLAASNLYVLALGMREIGANVSREDILTVDRNELERGLALLGLLLFKNEVKSDSALAIKMLKDGDIRSVVCTGDNALTAIGISKEVGIIDCNKPILLANINNNNQLTWIDVNNNNEIKETIDDPVNGVHDDQQLVVTRSVWRYLINNKEQLDKYWYNIKVYARMKPSDKVSVIKSLQSRKLVVGMCGDGGNDCGALRAAHAAMALSEAEASMVSPFSSSRDSSSLITVVDLIREGRACLATNLATYSYYIVYALILTVGRLFLTILGNFNIGEWIFIMTDLLLGVGMVWTSTLSGPAKTLAPYRPTASLLGWRTVLCCIIPPCIAFIALIIAYATLWSSFASSWYYRVDTLDMKVPPKDWMKKGDNYDTAVLVFIMFTVLANHVFTATFGGDFRCNILRNWSVTVFYCIFIGLSFALLWVNPCDLSCVYRVSCDSGASLATGSIPFVSEFSVGNIGGCFLGPQVHRYQELGYSDWTPSPEFNCLPPQEALQLLPYDSPQISALGYDGPNNVFSFGYRILMTVLLVVVTIVMYAFVKVGLLGRGAAFFRSRVRGGNH